VFRSSKEPAPVRLARLTYLPTFDSLSQALLSAQKNRNRPVELSWSANGREYFLNINYGPDSDPVWTLMHSRPVPRNVLMQHATVDVNLIANLISSACTGEAADSAIVDSSSSSKAIYLGSEDGRADTSHSTFNRLSTSPNLKNEGISDTASRVDSPLEGDLATLHLPNLLQSINMGKMTGRLNVKSTAGSGTIFFEEGEPRHVIGPESHGDAALLEMLTWMDGKFIFLPNERSVEQTISERLDKLLVLGIALLDQYQFLTQHGLTMESYLSRKDTQLTEQAFEQALSRGFPHDLSQQKRFYQYIDNKSTLFTILRRALLSKVEWIPTMFNLVSCNLVALSDKPPHSAQIGSLQGVQIDPKIINAAMRPNIRTETGIFTHPFFLFLLEQEFYRFEASSLPLVLLVMDLAMTHQSEISSLPIELLREIFVRIHAIKRKIDVLGHFETLDYGLILPFTDTIGGALVAQRIIETVLAATKDKGFDPLSIKIAIGVAGIPEDCKDLALLITAAKEARKRAKQSASAIMLFKNLHL